MQGFQRLFLANLTFFINCKFGYKIFAIYGGEHLTPVQKALTTININIIFPL